jgi:TolB-like protein/DNA-binding winged helix-turn-helix (wHTH) protein
MERPTATVIRIGDWCVNPTSGQISRDGQSTRLEMRTLRLLLCLADHAGEVVSIDDLLNEAWSGVVVSQDSVYHAVASLRRLLGDDPKQPTYIETVPRFGYRMVATVGPWADQSALHAGSLRISENEQSTPLPGDATAPGPPRRAGLVWTAGAALCLAVVGALLFAGKVRNGHQSTSSAVPHALRSIAVLPFHDLTEEMTQAPFADGMTADLIDKLSKIPGLRVHAPMSPSSLKGNRSTIADMARMLGVAYVVDGSVRKSGSRLRVVARLIHAEDEYVVWSQTYDRPWDDVLKIQDDIGDQVTKALSASF